MLLASEQQQPLYAQGGLLHSLPYFHSFQTTVKGRWIGRRLCDVFAEEFPSLGGLPYALRAFQAGKLRVTGAPSSKSSSAGNGGGGKGLKMDDLTVDDPSNPKKQKRKNADNADGSKGIKNNREICRGEVQREEKAAECGGSTVDGGDKRNQAVCGFYDSPHVDDVHHNETSNECHGPLLMHGMNIVHLVHRHERPIVYHATVEVLYPIVSLHQPARLGTSNSPAPPPTVSKVSSSFSTTHCQSLLV